ncbi:hypothetical protein [Planomonospora algeriensis]
MDTTRPAPVSGRRSAEETLAPLIGRLRAAATAGLPLGLVPGLRAEGDGWHSVIELTAPPYGRLSELVRETSLRWDAPPHVAAALWWKGVSYWTTLPVVIGWAATRHVPLMTAAGTALRSLPGEPHLQAGLSELRVVTGTVEEVGAIVRDTLLRDLHAPLIEALHALTRTGRRGLWGSVAEAIVHPLVTLAADLLDDPADAAETLLRSIGEPVADLVETPSMRRRTCCLWVRLPGREACSTCCVTPCD